MPRIPKDTPKPSTRDKKIKQTMFTFGLDDEYAKYSSFITFDTSVFKVGDDISFDIESFYPKG